MHRRHFATTGTLVRRAAHVSAFTVMLAVVLTAQPTKPMPPGAEAYVRQGASGDLSLLLTVAMNNAKVAEVQIDAPSDRRLAVGYLPDGWRFEQKGRKLQASGPPVAEANLRLTIPPGRANDYAGKTLNASLRDQDGEISRVSTVKIEALDALTVTSNIEDILSTVARATPGRPMLVGVAQDYRRGHWELVFGATATVPILPTDTPEQIELLNGLSAGDAYGSAAIRSVLEVLAARPAPWPWVAVLPPDGTVTGVRFTDRWGERVVEAPLTITPTPAETCPLHLSGGSEFAFAGQAACLTGCFPDLTSAFTLLMNGVEVTPWAVSNSSALIGIPNDATAGPHVIQVPGGSSQVKVGVLQLQGSIDTNLLWRGQSTAMHLRILGTDKSLPLVILNRTPGVITLEGGPIQVVNTAGGTDNAVSRSVKGIRRGNFKITYSLTAGCQGG